MCGKKQYNRCMILSDEEIQRLLDQSDIEIDPRPAPEDFSPSAVDLRLDAPLFRLQAASEMTDVPGLHLTASVDPRQINTHSLVNKHAVRHDLLTSPYSISPGEFVLGTTSALIDLKLSSRIAARVEGKSSLARLGLVVHMTAPTIHCGFRGKIVLEMMNFGPYPIVLSHGLSICQLILERVGSIPVGELRSTHQNQSGPN